MKNNIEEKKSILPWIIMAIAVVYDISPVDIIPDIPVVGWVDDFFISATAGLNLIQKAIGVSNVHLAKIVKIVKWTTIILGVIAVVLVLLLGALIVQMCNK